MPEVSFGVVSMNKRELLLVCLDSIFRSPPPFSFEVLVIDNASSDGSAAAVQARFGEQVSLVALERRAGKADNDSALLENSRGHYVLLLNDDSELLPGAAEELYSALERDGSAAAAGAQLLSPDQVQQPSAWRFPSIAVTLLGAILLGRIGIVQSKGSKVRTVDWAQSAALMVRRTAFEQVGPLDSQFFVYSDEVDWCKRAHGIGWHTLYVPTARVIHHEQLAGDDLAPRRIIEFARNRDRYMHKHHGRCAALVVRLLTAWTYMLRAIIAAALPGHSSKRYLLHVHATLRPMQGEGLREAAEAYNRKLAK